MAFWTVLAVVASILVALVVIAVRVQKDADSKEHFEEDSDEEEVSGRCDPHASTIYDRPARKTERRVGFDRYDDPIRSLEARLDSRAWWLAQPHVRGTRAEEVLRWEIRELQLQLLEARDARTAKRGPDVLDPHAMLPVLPDGSSCGCVQCSDNGGYWPRGTAETLPCPGCGR